MKEEYELNKFDKEKKKRQRLTKMMNQKYLREPLILHKKEMPKNLPGKEETTEFWKNINEKIRETDINNEKINEILNKLDIQEWEWKELTKEELEEAIKYTPNWKSPGPDGIYGFFIKKLINVKEHLLTIIKKLLKGEEEIPSMMFKGRTSLIYKKGEEKEPKNYRPITCLPVLTKIITSIIAKRLQIHYMNKENMILEDKQRGVRPGIQGTKDCLLYGKMAHKEKIIEAYYDFEKAYDSVNHEWLIKLMNSYKFPTTLINILKNMMEQWKIGMNYGNEEICEIQLKNGIIQGDSLSPFLFVLTLDPLIKILKEENIGVEIAPNRRIDVLYYMDDLKIITDKTSKMSKTHEIVS